MFASLLLLACGAEPEQYEVVNKTAPAFTVMNRVKPAAQPDPYGYPDYAEFHRLIVAGLRGILVVGVPDRHVGTYVYHCRVPTGFGGLSDGEYDARAVNGVATLERREEVSRPAFPKASSQPESSSPADSGVVTSVLSVGTIPVAPTRRVVGVQYHVPTSIPVPLAPRGATRQSGGTATNCALPFG